MEENISHAFAMVGSAILFVIALSCAMLSYNQLTDRAEMFFGTRSAAGLRGDGTSTLLDPDEVERKVKFSELYVAILNLPRYVTTEGNSVCDISIVGNGRFVNYTATVDPLTSEKTITMSGSLNGEYKVNDKNDMLDLLKDLCTVALGYNPAGSSSNDALRQIESLYETTTYSIDYSETSITYSKN
ncbi:MAG: hypothetical protein IJX99_04635 [Clostridia bacterium]|nr:hypothetical protein [Clostridia bacterium]